MASAKFQHNLMSLQKNMLNFAYMLTSNRDDAYSLLQSTTLSALVNEDKYTEGTNFKGWIFTIMRDIFANDFSHATPATEGSGAIYHLRLTREATKEEPEACYSESEITAAISELDDDLRVIMSMHLTGYSYSEIADQIGCTTGDVRTRVRTGSRSLFNRLTNACDNSAGLQLSEDSRIQG